MSELKLPQGNLFLCTFLYVFPHKTFFLRYDITEIINSHTTFPPPFFLSPRLLSCSVVVSTLPQLSYDLTQVCVHTFTVTWKLFEGLSSVNASRGGVHHPWKTFQSLSLSARPSELNSFLPFHIPTFNHKHLQNDALNYKHETHINLKTSSN